MKKALKILLILILVAALTLVGLSVYLRTTQKEAATPLVKHFSTDPSLTWSKVWLTMYGYKITYSDQDSIHFDNTYWSGVYSGDRTWLNHDEWNSVYHSIEADAGAVIGELKDLCGGYMPYGGNIIVFSYQQKHIYVSLPDDLLTSVTISFE